jgi:thymidylate synthase (FAD)
MNIVRPYARICGRDIPSDPFTQADGIAMLRRIEYFGRISHRSEDAQTEDSWKRFIEAVVIGKGDWSITEHASVTVDSVTDRGITHEWVRHRHLSITQESTRFVNYEKKMPAAFIRPDVEDVPHQIITDALDHCEQSYRLLIKAGIAPQIARCVFPNALASRMATTTNLRNWRYVFLMRTTKEAHPQIREVMIPLLDEFQQKIPILFSDIEPNARQIENLRKPK